MMDEWSWFSCVMPAATVPHADQVSVAVVYPRRRDPSNVVFLR